MKFTSGFVAVLAALPEALAVQFTNSAYNVVAGQPIDLTWSDSVGAVTISLKNGNTGDLKTVMTIGSGLSGGSYTWTPASSLPSDTYALEIVDSTNVPNYSPQFSFQGSGTASASSSTATSTGSSSSASSTGSVTSTITSSASSSSSTDSSSTITSSSSRSSSSISSASNSTMTTHTSSSASASTSSRASATSTTTPANTNNGQRLGSPLAFILVTAATLLIFN